MSDKKILDNINFPADLKKLSNSDLKILFRGDMDKKAVSKYFHLGAGLGVVELTVALHYIFNTQRIKLFGMYNISYPHKILTGRKDKIETLRTGGGLSGFTKRDEK